MAMASMGTEEAITIKEGGDLVEVTIIMMKITPSMMTRAMMIWT